MIFMTFSFLWWLSIVKAPNVKKKKKNKTKQNKQTKIRVKGKKSETKYTVREIREDAAK